MAGIFRLEDRLSKTEPCSAGETATELGLHFPVVGKTAGLHLRVDHLTVQLDLEDATAPFDELGFDAELLLYLVRQTGGSRQVVSNYTILNGHLSHFRYLVERRICVLARKTAFLDRVFHSR